jgi:cell division protein FtsB
MSGPSQRAAERQAARRSSSTRLRRSASVPSAKSRTAAGPSATTVANAGSTGKRASGKGTSAKGRSLSGAAAAVRDRPSLTGRAVILAGVLALLVFTLAVPARELIHQRADINALRAENAAAAARVDELTIRQERLQDPAYVTSLIRERLHYVLPGEVGYVVLDPSEAPAPAAKKKAATVVPWYGQLWDSVQTADHAVQPDAPTPIVLPSNAPR